MGLFKKDEPQKVDPPTPEPTPPPEFVTKAEFSQLDQRLARMADLMEQGFSRPVVVAQTPTPIVEEPDVSDAELDAAIEAGKDAAPRIKHLIEKKIGKAQREVKAELDTFRNYGTTMLSTLAERVATSSMDPELLKRFDGEIKDLVNQCDPALRGHPETWQTAYDTIVGRHSKQLRDEAVEADRRRHAEEEQARSAALPGRSARPQADDDGDVPSLTALAGDFAPRLGDMSEEEFIRRINRGLPARRRYKDWNDYNARGRDVEKELASIRQGDEYHDGSGPLPDRLH